MRLEGDEPGQPLHEVWISLTRTEVERLCEVLDGMLALEETDPEWHAHVPSDDASSQITVGWQA